MSVSAYYKELIASSYERIKEKKAENEDLARQETEQKKLLSQEKDKLKIDLSFCNINHNKVFFTVSQCKKKLPGTLHIFCSISL